MHLSAEGGRAGGSLRVETLDITDAAGFEFPDDLRVLVNNAGHRMSNLPLEDTPMAEWREVFETNVFGTVDVTRRAVPLLRRQSQCGCSGIDSLSRDPQRDRGLASSSSTGISSGSDS